MEPRASVIIRSKDRLPELGHLVGLVLAQDAPSFEVVIVDSTAGASDEALWSALGTRDARIRLLRTPARGCAAAANYGVQHSRGEILVFVDDDDLPEGRDWLSSHLRNYADPCCLGVNGRMLRDDDPVVCDPRAGRRMLRFGFFKNARWYESFGGRVVGIEFLMGGNASLRRSAYERGGGWDEFLPYHNECSLFLRLGRVMSAWEYLAYDPSARMTIRRDIPGGVGQRADRDLRRFVDTLSKYYLWTVAPLFPGRMYGLGPFFAGYFAWSTAKNWGRYVREQPGGGVEGSGSEVWRALRYVPGSLVRHLGTRPRGA